MTNPAANRYLTNRVATASPAELIGLLYDGALRFLRTAAELQRSGDHRGASLQINRAQDIVVELRCCLNHEAGAVAADLDRIYDYAFRRLVDAVVRRDPASLDEVIQILVPLQDGWGQACLGRTPATA